MFTLKHTMRNALTLALIGMAIGVLQGCTSESPTGVTAVQYDETTECVWVNGVLICK